MEMDGWDYSYSSSSDVHYNEPASEPHVIQKSEPDLIGEYLLQHEKDKERSLTKFLSERAKKHMREKFIGLGGS